MALASVLRLTAYPQTPQRRGLPLMWRPVTWIAQWFCGLRGHEMVVHFAPDRMSLCCLSCGAETLGWSINVDPRFGRPLLMPQRAADRSQSLHASAGRHRSPLAGQFTGRPAA
jgi:hypothetical protein